MNPTTVTAPSRFAQLAEGIPKPFWALLVGTFITKAGSFVMPLLFVYLTQSRNLSLPLAGAITSLYGLGALVGNLVGGTMADRFGRRFTMLLSLLVGAIFLLILGVASEVWQLGLATFLLSLTAEAYRPASQALVADIVPAQHRMKAFGLQYWAINLGFACASVIGGYMAKRNFTVLFLGDALTTIILAGIVWKSVPESRPAQSPTKTAGHVFTPFVDVRYAPFLFLNFLTALMFFQHLSALPNDMLGKGLTTEDFGWAMAANGLVIVLFQPLVTRWATGRAQRRVLSLASIVTGLGFGLTAFATSLSTYALTVAAWTVGEMLFAPINATIVAARSPLHLRGRYQGAFTLTWSGACMLAPLVGTSVIDLWGHQTLWLGCFALGLLVAVAHFAMSSRPAENELNRVEGTP